MAVAYLSTDEVEHLHERIIRDYGGASLAVRDSGALESALATPQQAVFGTELYATLDEKAAVLLFLLIQNHPFVDGQQTHRCCVAGSLHGKKPYASHCNRR